MSSRQPRKNSWNRQFPLDVIDGKDPEEEPPVVALQTAGKVGSQQDMGGLSSVCLRLSRSSFPCCLQTRLTFRTHPLKQTPPFPTLKISLAG